MLLKCGLYVLLQVVAVFWRSTPNHYAWRFDYPLVVCIFMVIHCLAWLQMLCSLFHLDHLELFGIKQVCIVCVCVCACACVCAHACVHVWACKFVIFECLLYGLQFVTICLECFLNFWYTECCLCMCVQSFSRGTRGILHP